MFSDWLNIQCRNTITVFEPDKTDFQTFHNFVSNSFSFSDSVLHDIVVEVPTATKEVSQSFAFVASDLRIPIYDLPLQLLGTVSTSSTFIASTLQTVVIPLSPSPIPVGTVRNVSVFLFSELKVVLVPLPTVLCGTVRQSFAFTASTLA